MSHLRSLAALALLLVACTLSMASLALMLDGEEMDAPVSVNIDDASALNGCYTQSGGAQLNSYWFDGVERCQNIMWNSMTGSVSYGCTYTVSQGQLDIAWDDGSSNSYAVAGADNGITLDGTLYEYAGASCE